MEQVHTPVSLASLLCGREGNALSTCQHKIMSLLYKEAHQALLPQCLLHVCSRGARNHGQRCTQLCVVKPVYASLGHLHAVCLMRSPWGHRTMHASAVSKLSVADILLLSSCAEQQHGEKRPPRTTCHASAALAELSALHADFMQTERACCTPHQPPVCAAQICSR